MARVVAFYAEFYDVWPWVIAVSVVVFLCVWRLLRADGADGPENWGGEWRDEEGCMVFEEDDDG